MKYECERCGYEEWFNALEGSPVGKWRHWWCLENPLADICLCENCCIELGKDPLEAYISEVNAI